jgi:hypothetical protein
MFFLFTPIYLVVGFLVVFYISFAHSFLLFCCVFSQVIDGILSTVESFVSNNSATKPKVETLVNNVLDFLCTSRSTPKSFLTKHPGDYDPDATNIEQNKHKNVSAHFFLFFDTSVSMLFLS